MYKKIIFLLCLFISLFFLSQNATAETDKKIVGLGLGISNAIPTIELNLFMKPMPLELNPRYYFSRGLELSFKIHVIQKKHLRWHIIDPGVYFLMGTTPLSVADVKKERDMDISLGTGIDIFPYKNLAISFNLRWFLPGISAAYAAGGDAAIKYTVENFKIEPDKTLEEIIRENGEKAFEIASKKTREMYIKALKEPQIQLVLTWFFY
jgi:hypothetical protein